ncbi:MAG TPA: hypothetical protein VGQ35_18645 [Dongiaceae bacterium]|nr:hypothetical protein [Dongiaceae bacterium]
MAAPPANPEIAAAKLQQLVGRRIENHSARDAEDGRDEQRHADAKRPSAMIHIGSMPS